MKHRRGWPVRAGALARLALDLELNSSSWNQFEPKSLWRESVGTLQLALLRESLTRGDTSSSRVDSEPYNADARHSVHVRPLVSTRRTRGASLLNGLGAAAGATLMAMTCVRAALRLRNTAHRSPRLLPTFLTLNFVRIMPSAATV